MNKLVIEDVGDKYFLVAHTCPMKLEKKLVFEKN